MFGNSTTISNGGFYIARYEAGNEGGTLVSKAYAIVYNDINWSDSKTKAENMYSVDTYGVTSTLIYGTQWDAALKFIGAYNGDTSYVIDSTDKGNYNTLLKGSNI